MIQKSRASTINGQPKILARADSCKLCTEMKYDFHWAEPKGLYYEKSIYSVLWYTHVLKVDEKFVTVFRKLWMF